MENAIIQVKAVPARRRRSSLNRLDFLLIAASVLVFVVNAAIHPSHRRAQNSAAPVSADLPEQTGHAGNDPGLIKARIAIARIGNM